ncbi:DUF983 domain-containing protein [Nereida sp. MMG025]|uniref:DUF983 domain-containing protein n=1 Tax=Nereida sp. MMG025 TaxID=2909981 RepID=UPI001F44A6BF|nr:DUF983 domain-containing protein [Nereida sp. MMG025]MCF6445104.1 DUF983 domain-containing protein [Nereida sp. MMG025]
MKDTLDVVEERAMKPALKRGWRCRCPRCGTGRLFASFLKVEPNCMNCGQDLSGHRADDGPAYLTILIVGHLMAPLLHVAFVHWRPDPLVLATTFSIGCVALSLYLLPRLKGVVIAVQWAKYMHGFKQA